jgi:hypothetical protein
MSMGCALFHAQIELIYLLICTQYTVHTMTAVYILAHMYTVHTMALRSSHIACPLRLVPQFNCCFCCRTSERTRLYGVHRDNFTFTFYLCLHQILNSEFLFEVLFVFLMLSNTATAVAQFERHNYASFPNSHWKLRH